MKRILVTILASVFVFLVTVDDSLAQATAQISGTAKDQSGAVLPGVEIHATQIETGIIRDAISNETGSYVLTNLPIGPYRLEASLPGFRTYVQSGIILQVNSSPSINVVLEVGQVTEQVEVQANAALVETRNAGVGQVVENARILELPLNGRQVVELVALAGAAAPAPIADGSARDPFSKGNVSVAGGLNKGLNFSLDGAFHNNPQSNSYMSLPFPDALQEFKVETSASGAGSGVKSSGSVSLVTKSGTNQFHGNLFEFVRNGMFNARNAFALRRDTIKRNQFGGTFGGPVIQNKLFFFGGYQGTIVRQDPSDLISFVPTAAILAGDFTAFSSPACNAGRQIALRAPFVNNRVDPALFSKAALNLASKLPKTSDPCGKVIYGNPSRENGHMVVGRIDYQRNSNHSIFGRYLLDGLKRPAPFDLNHNPLSSNGNNTPKDNALAQAFTIGDTYLFGANVVNSFRLTGNRIAAGKFTPDSMPQAGLGTTDIGVKAYTDSPHMPRYSVTGGFSVSAFGGSTRTAVFAGSDDLSVIRGNHQFAIGASDAVWWINSYSTTYHANFAFNGQTTGLGMSDFFMGNVSTLVNGPTAPQNKRAQYLGAYGADTWKVNQKLTLSYGLRWEPFLPIVNIDGSAIHFDMDALKKGIKTTKFDNAPPGVFFPGDPGFQGGRAAMNTRWMNFSPRAGFAWDIAGDGRTSLRASFGQFYDFPNSHYYVGLTAAPPWMTRITVNDVNFDNPWSAYPGGDPYPMPNGRGVTRNVPWQSYGVVTAMDYNTPNMRVAQWNLSLQKQIGSDWLVSTSYIGNGSSHLWSMQHVNPGIFLGTAPCTLNNVQYTSCSTTTNLDQRRLLSLENPQVGQKYGYIFHIDSGGTASYNGLLVSVQRRAARGVTVSANYTWSHCISDPAGDNVGISGTAGNSGYTKPDNRRFDRGNCTLAATDRRHLFNLSAVASTPTFSNRGLRAVASGWTVSPIFRVLSGGYLTVTTSTDRSLTGIFNQRLNQVLPNPYGDKSNNNYLNPAAFTLPAVGTYGNVGSGSISGPGSWQFDAALSRTFRMGETEKFEFRAEAFNVTNSFRMEDPTTNFNSNIFGQVTSAKDPRIMQFALKYFF